tara:strand:+ start:379 stop:630 length:252 start_codon:yes stop_codon:yes gene_type:complete
MQLAKFLRDPLGPGDFGTLVSGEFLLVPSKIFDYLTKGQNIRTSQGFVKFAQDFPEFLASLLDWTEEEVHEALVKLEKQLQEE